MRNAKNNSLALNADPTTSLPTGDPGTYEIAAVEVALAIWKKRYPPAPYASAAVHGPSAREFVVTPQIDHR